MSMEKRQKERRRERHAAAAAEFDARRPERQEGRRELGQSIEQNDLDGAVRAAFKTIWRSIK